MSYGFRAEIEPDAALLGQLELCTPRSPFNSHAYNRAVSHDGVSSCALILTSAEQIVGGCLGQIHGNKWTRILEIATAPSVVDPRTFWNGIAEFCSQNSICDLRVDTFGSFEPTMPEFANELSRADRLEYILTLDPTRDLHPTSSNHRRNIKKASGAGLIVQRSRQPEDCATHLQLMRASMTRRINRGEDVSLPGDSTQHATFVESGIGELFQARLDGNVLASILILKTDTVGYYHSAGTTPEGMSLGASPFLIHGVALQLAIDGLRWFNLGGTGTGADAEGLRRFKKGFGAQEQRLESVSYSMIPIHSRFVRKVAGKLETIKYLAARSIGLSI